MPPPETGNPMEGSIEIGTSRKSKKSIRKLVLIIDDSPDALEINRTILELDGYEVASAESGDEALSLLPKIPKPDLILLDMSLGETSGMDFLKTLARTSPATLTEVPIVFFSGVDAAPESVAAGFIRKPVAVDKFLAAVRYYIDKGKGKGRYRH